MDNKNHDEKQSKIPDIVKIKRGLMKIQNENNFLKETIVINQKGIEQRDNYIKELKNTINEQNTLINNAIKTIQKEIPKYNTIQNNIKKKNKSFLKLIK